MSAYNKKQEEFWKACEEGNIEIFQNLLNDPEVDPSIRETNENNKDLDEDEKENRALVTAVRNGHLPIVRVLLGDSRIRIDPNSEVIDIAAEKENSDLVSLLLNDPRIKPDEAVGIAAEKGNLQIVQLLLQNSRTVLTSDTVSKIIKEKVDNQQEILSLLLNDPRLQDLSPVQSSRLLKQATENEDIEIIKILLRYLPPNLKLWSSLKVAVEEGLLDIVRLLLNNPSADPSEDDSILLSIAHEKGYTEIQALLECDPRVDKNVLRKGEIEWEKYFLTKIDHIKQVLYNFKPESGVNKKRKFTETVEIQITLRKYDPSRDKRFNQIIYLSHPRQGINVVIFGNDHDCSEAKKNGLMFYTLDDLKSFNKDKKKIRKSFKKNKLVILCSPDIIRLIPRIMGPQLARMGRFPVALDQEKPFLEQVELAKKKVVLKSVKNTTVMSCAMGNVNLTVDQLIENLRTCIIELGKFALREKGWKTCDKIYLKTTMGRPECIYNYSDWFSPEPPDSD